MNGRKVSGGMCSECWCWSVSVCVPGRAHEMRLHKDDFVITQDILDVRLCDDEFGLLQQTQFTILLLLWDDGLLWFDACVFRYSSISG